jgi:hypothetical protein
MKPADKQRFPSLDKGERKNVAVLEERRRYLAERLTEGNCSEAARLYLRDERDALDWALGEVAACHEMVTP